MLLKVILISQSGDMILFDNNAMKTSNAQVLPSIQRVISFVLKLSEMTLDLI